MTEEGLKFLLTAEVSQFDKAMKGAETAAENAAKGIVAAGVRIEGSGNYVNALQKDLKGLVAGLKTGETQFVSTGMAVSRSGQMIQDFGQQVATIPRNLKASGSVTNSFNQILRETPNFAINAQIGILGLSNNIPIFVDAVTQAIRASGGFSSVLRGLAASIFSIGGVIQLGVTLITIFSKELFGAEDAAKKTGDEIKKLSDIQKSYNENLNKTRVEAAGEVATLNELFRIASDETKSRKDRVAALKELKEATDGYLDSLTLETINTDKARAALDEFNKSLFISALIKSNQKRVEELADSYSKFAQIGQDGKKRIQELNRLIQEANRPGGDIEGESRFDRVVRLSRERTNLILETNSAIKQQNAIYDEILATGTKIAGLEVQLDPFKKETTDKAEKSVKTIQDVLRELEKDLTSLNVAFASTGTNVRDLADDKIKRLEKALKDLADFGVRPGSELFIQIDQEIKRLQDSLNRTPVDISIPLNIQPVQAATSNVRNSFKELVDSFNFQEITATQQKLQDAFQNSIRSGAAGIASGIGEAIGGLISGAKDLGDVFSGVIGLFGRFIKQLGESMIAAGTATIAAKLLIKNPYTAVAAGIIAVAAGAAIEGSLSRYPSFATGGTVYGSQLIAAGDNTTQKEHILSDLQLKKIADGAGIGSGGGTVIAEARISGTDLVILMRNAQNSIGSING